MQLSNSSVLDSKSSGLDTFWIHFDERANGCLPVYFLGDRRRDPKRSQQQKAVSELNPTEPLIKIYDY
jgi:hypothetical protein